MDTFIYPEGDYSFLANNEEVLSTSCTVISIIFYNRKTELEYVDLSHFDFKTGKGVVCFFTITGDDDPYGEGEEFRIVRDCSLAVGVFPHKKDFMWWKNGSLMGITSYDEFDDGDEWDDDGEENCYD